MVEQLRAVFEADEEFVELMVELQGERRPMEAVFASPQQIFVIAAPLTEKDLEESWERVAETVAVEVQGRLEGELSDLRWDLYLIYPVLAPEVHGGLQKKIENNRRFFRKLVFAEKDAPFLSRLPFCLEVGQVLGGLFFGEAEFLQELQGCLGEAAQQLGADFFQKGISSPEELVQILVGGESADEDSSA